MPLKLYLKLHPLRLFKKLSLLYNQTSASFAASLKKRIGFLRNRTLRSRGALNSAFRSCYGN